MTTLDHLTCIGGPAHGAIMVLPKDQVDEILKATGPDGDSWHYYRRLPVFYPGQDGSFHALFHETISAADSVRAYQAWRHSE